MTDVVTDADTRTERAVAADTLVVLLLNGVLKANQLLDACAAAGLSVAEIQDAKTRYRQTGFLSPRPIDAGTERPTVTGKQRSWPSNEDPFKRRCPLCREIKDYTEFRIKDQATRARSNRCTECMRSLARERYLNLRKIEALNSVGLTFWIDEDDDVVGLACVRCKQPLVPGDEVQGTTELAHVSCVSAANNA